MELGMPQPPEALAMFWSQIVSAFSGEKLDDDKYQDARKEGAYPNLSQQLRESHILKAGDDCQVHGKTHTNREHIQEVVRDYWQTMKSPFDPAIRDDPSLPEEEQDRRADERQKRRRDREKIYPTWDGRVRDITGSLLEPDDRFNASEVRAIREFGKRLVRNNERDWLERIIDPETWAIGDTKLICDSNKVNDAQTSHRSALAMGEEFKDGKDLGIYGPWKSPWKEEAGMLEGLKNNWGKVWGVRNAQLSGSDDLGKEVDNARKAVSHFNADEAAVKNVTFDFAFGHGDLSEYVRLSPNYDDKIGWVKIPEGISDDQFDHIDTNIDELSRDSLTAQIASVTGRSAQEIAELRELFFRSKEMADRLSGGLHIKWTDAWDYTTEARVLISVTLEASDWKQGLQMARQGANKAVHSVTMGRVDLPGKMLDARFATIIAFGLSLGIGLMINIFVFGDTVAWLALIEALILTVTFNQMIGVAEKHESPGKFYVLLGLLVLAAFVIKFGGDYQREGINSEFRQQEDRFDRAIGIKK